MGQDSTGQDRIASLSLCLCLECARRLHCQDKYEKHAKFASSSSSSQQHFLCAFLLIHLLLLRLLFHFFPQTFLKVQHCRWVEAGPRSLFSLYALSLSLPFGCCVFCITKCKLILLLQARGRGRYVAFLLVARMKFNGFHFVVVCNDPRATPRQHAMPVWGGAEQTARWGKRWGGYAKHFVLFCHVNYASAAFLLVVVAVAVSPNETEIIIFCLI